MAKAKQPEVGDVESGVQKQAAGHAGGPDQEKPEGSGADGLSSAQGVDLPPVAATQLSTAKLVKARVLVDCALGKCDDVVEIDAADVKPLAGTVDSDPKAVAYAESLAAD